jgi:hypothetical protein
MSTDANGTRLKRSKLATTTKQFGDACEMAVAGKMGMRGMPTQKMADLWPGYDLIAQPRDRSPQRISVKGTRAIGRTDAFIVYMEDNAQFDWLAIVMVADDDEDIYLVPRSAFEAVAKRSLQKKGAMIGRTQVYVTTREVRRLFERFKSNWMLDEAGAG